MSVSITESPQPEALAARARCFLAEGRLGAAQPIVAALRAVAPGTALAAELEARVLFARGAPGDAASVLDAALTADQSSPTLFLARAELRSVAGDHVGAAADSAEAVVLDPGNPGAKALLGRALLRLGRVADAITCLDEALATQPSAAAARLDLAEALDASASPELADAVIAGGITLDPGNAALLGRALLHRMRAGDFAAVVRMAEAARARGALDAPGFGLLGHALSSVGRHDEAAAAYGEAFKLAPDDPCVRHLAAAGRSGGGEHAPAEYIRALFDDYAERFDGHLIRLGYRIPGVLRGLLALCPAPSASPVLDLGCGTGLLAVTCKDVAPGDWIGVDLSPKMLGAARAKALYAELHEAELLAYLATEARVFPLVLAGDVLCYLGDLMQVMGAVAPRLVPGGRFLCTVERLASSHDEVRLGRMGRYNHSQAHVLRAASAAGLAVVSVTEDVLRHEAGAPVPGLLVVLERPA